MLTSPANFASGWSAVNANLTLSGTGPDGQQSLFNLAPTSTTRPDALFQAVNVASAGSYTISVFAKANGFNWLGLGFGNGATADGAFFNLATGTVGTVAAGDQASLQALGNGLYRVSVTRSLSAGGGFEQIEVHSANGEGINTGVPGANGTSGVLLADAVFQGASQFQQADSLQNMQNLVGSSFNDTLVGAAGGNSILAAGMGNDVVTGNGNNNTLIAGTGTDTLINSGSASFFKYQPADGVTTIVNGSGGNAASSNELDFGGSLTDENLWLLQSGNNLQIDVMGTQNHVTIRNWFSGVGNTLSEITAGGLKLDTQVAQLVQAMATFQTNNPGFDPTAPVNTAAPNDTSLQNAIAAAWHA
jgi:Ca2+-binding RTX toxin-like protein